MQTCYIDTAKWLYKDQIMPNIHQMAAAKLVYTLKELESKNYRIL